MNAITAKKFTIIKSVITHTRTGAITNMATNPGRSTFLKAASANIAFNPIMAHLAAAGFLTDRGLPRLEGSMGVSRVSSWVQGSEVQGLEV